MKQNVALQNVQMLPAVAIPTVAVSLLYISVCFPSSPLLYVFFVLSSGVFVPISSFSSPEEIVRPAGRMLAGVPDLAIYFSSCVFRISPANNARTYTLRA